MKYVAGLHQPIGWLGQAGGVVWCWRWQQQGAQCSLLPPGLPLLNSPPQMLNNFSTFQTLSYHGESVQLELTSTTLCRTEMRSISAIFSALHAVLSILWFWHLWKLLEPTNLRGYWCLLSVCVCVIWTINHKWKHMCNSISSLVYIKQLQKQLEQKHGTGQIFILSFGFL